MPNGRLSFRIKILTKRSHAGHKVGLTAYLTTEKEHDEEERKLANRAGNETKSETRQIIAAHS